VIAGRLACMGRGRLPLTGFPTRRTPASDGRANRGLRHWRLARPYAGDHRSSPAPNTSLHRGLVWMALVLWFELGRTLAIAEPRPLRSGRPDAFYAREDIAILRA